MKKKVIAALLILGLLLCATGALLCNDTLRISLKERISYPECPANPKPGKWYSLTPENAVCADGSAWRGRIRFGDQDKLLIYLLGGGVVLDEYSAGQSYSAAGSKAFYYDNDLGVSASRIQGGIASDGENNPFRDWTILVVPYATGDFHIGTAGIHQGYANFVALMDVLQTRIDAPGQLLIAGYSAGGFGAAMLAEDILCRFPGTKNAALCIDSALLLNEHWQTIVSELWHAPDHIAGRIRSDNLTLDHLVDFNTQYPEVKILFSSSVRDGGLAKFQSYIDGGAYETTVSGGESYAENLREMVSVMREKLPSASFYLWDDARNGRPTRHTILYRDDFFAERSETSMAAWMLRSLSGETLNCGLELLQIPAQ